MGQSAAKSCLLNRELMNSRQLCSHEQDGARSKQQASIMNGEEVCQTPPLCNSGCQGRESHSSLGGVTLVIFSVSSKKKSHTCVQHEVDIAGLFKNKENTK